MTFSRMNRAMHASCTASSSSSSYLNNLTRAFRKKIVAPLTLTGRCTTVTSRPLGSISSASQQPPQPQFPSYHDAPSSLPCITPKISTVNPSIRPQSLLGEQQRPRIRWSSSSSSSSSGASSSSDVYTEEQRKQDHKHCVEMVQNRDMEGYLCGLLMPSSAREAYFALRAFNVEIASIKDASMLVGGRSRGASQQNSEEGGGDASLASRLRMAWWRDGIAELYENDNAPSNNRNDNDSILKSLTSSRKRNPTIRSLAHAIHTHNLTHQFLRRIMEARESDLDVLTQYDTLRDMARYGEDTVSSVLYLSLECMGVRDDNADNVASDVGVGLGLVTALRSTGFRATQGESSIPADLGVKYGVSMDTLWSAWGASISAGPGNNNDNDNNSQEAREALRNASREMADMASFHLHRARENQHAVPKEGRMCLLPAVCGLQYLDSLKGCDYDVLHPKLVGGENNTDAGAERSRKLGLMLLLGRTWLTGTF